jgi:hypothetical protein
MALGSPPDVPQRLAELKAEAALEFARRSAPAPSPYPPAAPKQDLPAWIRPARRILIVGLLVALPFLVLVRGSVYFYAQRGWPSWFALVGAGAATLVVVGVYGAWLARRFTGRARFTAMVQWVALPLVLGFCGRALLYVSRSHAKADAVRAEYRATHPLLRVALSTLVLANRDLLITDLARVPADYPRMGLPVNDGTLHYRQRDGWAHAVDLRTNGRGEVVNRLVELYFRVMGFRTLRHVGTADHLHVELPIQ